MSALTGKKIAFLTSQKGIEEAELVQPWQAVHDAGGEPALLAPEAGTVQTVNHDDEKAGTYDVDVLIGDASASDYDAIVIPGGTINADKLRLVPGAVQLVKDAAAGGVVIAAVCHGPWALVEADVLSGKVLTSYPSLKTDIENSGGYWIDEEVHVDDTAGWTLITSRNPGDLDAFGAAIVEQVGGTAS